MGARRIAVQINGARRRLLGGYVFTVRTYLRMRSPVTPHSLPRSSAFQICPYLLEGSCRISEDKLGAPQMRVRHLSSKVVPECSYLFEGVRNAKAVVHASPPLWNAMNLA